MRNTAFSIITDYEHHSLTGLMSEFLRFNPNGVPMTSAWNLKAGALMLTAALVPYASAVAQERAWFAHVGPGIIDTDENATVAVAGTVIPGSGIRMKSRLAGVIEVGRFVTPNLAIGIAAGLPVKQSIIGAGTIAPYGKLGRITYGPTAATVQWHPLRSAVIQPYVGAGIAYLHVFDSDGASLRDLHVSDDVGPVLQGGFELPVKSHWGLFVDAKKAFLRTHATGSLGAAPVAARIRMDPLVLHAGLSIRF